MLVTRQIARDADPVVLQAASGLVATAVLAPLVLLAAGRGWPELDPVAVSGADWRLLALLGVLGTVAHLRHDLVAPLRALGHPRADAVPRDPLRDARRLARLRRPARRPRRPRHRRHHRRRPLRHPPRAHRQPRHRPARPLSGQASNGKDHRPGPRASALPRAIPPWPGARSRPLRSPAADAAARRRRPRGRPAGWRKRRVGAAPDQSSRSRRASPPAQASPSPDPRRRHTLGQEAPPPPAIPPRISYWHETLSSRRGAPPTGGRNSDSADEVRFRWREAAKAADRQAPAEREPLRLPEAGAPFASPHRAPRLTPPPPAPPPGPTGRCRGSPARTRAPRKSGHARPPPAIARMNSAASITFSSLNPS